MARSRPNSSRSTASKAGTSAGPQRLQKILAAAGLGSRRACEELITTGRVQVDGEIVTELGAKADPVRQKIRVDGEPLRRVRFRYFALHKPPGVVSTARDPSGRPRVVDMVPQDVRVFPVGRLDKGSEGLILLTNDGELTNGLTHPRYAVRKTYHVLTAGHITGEDLQVLHRGVHLAEGVARVVSAKIRSTEGKATWLEIVLDEGRNREIRRILARVGHKVMRLIRVEMGGVRLGEMPAGTFRQLTPREIDKLREAVRESRKRKAARAEAKAAAAAQAVAPATSSRSKSPRPTKKAAAAAPDRPPRKRTAGGRERPRVGRKGPRIGSLIGLEDEQFAGVPLDPVEVFPEERDEPDRPPRRPGRPGRPGRKGGPRKGIARKGAAGKGGPRKGSGGKASGGKTTRRKTAKPKTVARKTTRRKGAGRRPGR